MIIQIWFNKSSNSNNKTFNRKIEFICFVLRNLNKYNIYTREIKLANSL